MKITPHHRPREKRPKEDRCNYGLKVEAPYELHKRVQDDRVKITTYNKRARRRDVAVGRTYAHLNKHRA